MSNDVERNIDAIEVEALAITLAVLKKWVQSWFDRLFPQILKNAKIVSGTF